jgi:hypothetical protein
MELDYKDLKMGVGQIKIILNNHLGTTPKKTIQGIELEKKMHQFHLKTLDKLMSISKETSRFGGVQNLINEASVGAQIESKNLFNS